MTRHQQEAALERAGFRIIRDCLDQQTAPNRAANLAAMHRITQLEWSENR